MTKMVPSMENTSMKKSELSSHGYKEDTFADHVPMSGSNTREPYMLKCLLTILDTIVFISS